MPPPLQLIKGTLDVLVLKALTWGPQHGFGIACWLEERSDQRLEIEDSALYQALIRLEGKGLIEQHQMVYAALKEEMGDQRIHALALKTFTPEQWAKLGS